MKDQGATEGNHQGYPVPSDRAVKRSKILWRVFMIFNFALGGYMFIHAQSTKKEKAREKAEAPPKEAASAPIAETVAPVQEEQPVEVTLPVEMPEIVRQPIPENQQRELFKWMLEEKRKVKPRNREEKKKIDEEKAILKHFIRSESLPKI